MVNIFGFFIEGMGDVDRNTGAITLKANGQSVIGRIMTIPAEATGASTLAWQRLVSRDRQTRSLGRGHRD